MIALLSLIATTAGLLLIEQQKTRTMRFTQQLTDQYLGNIQDRLGELSALNVALGSLVKVQAGDTQLMPAFARELLNHYPHLSHFAVAPKGIIERVYPVTGNELALGLNEMIDPRLVQELRALKRSSPISISGPLMLAQGRTALLSRMAIYLDHADSEEFWGFSHSVMDLAALLDAAQLNKLDSHGYFYRLNKISHDIDNTATSTITTNAPASRAEGIFADASSAEFSLASGNWQLQVIPKHGWIDIAYAARIIILIIGLGAVLIYLAYLSLRLLRQRKDLRSLIDTTTDQLEYAHARLKATLDALPDYLFEVDENLKIHAFHSRQKAFLATAAADLIDQNFSDVCKQTDATQLQQLIHTARLHGTCNDRISVQAAKQERTFSLSMSALSNSDAAASSADHHFLILCRDISDMVRDENELRIAATAFDTYNGMMVTDANKKILRVNQAFTSITGYSAADTIGRTPNLLSSGLHDKEFYRSMWQTIAREGRWQGEIWNRRAQGDIYPEWLAIAAVKNAAGEVSHYVSTLTDISTHKENERRIERLSFTDDLTQLANKNGLIRAVDLRLEKIKALPAWTALLYIDIKNFKFFNENRGQHMGDLLLRSVANRLSSYLRDGDTLARITADNFAILLTHFTDEKGDPVLEINQRCQEILDDLACAHRLKGEEVFCSAIIGKVIFDTPEHSAQTYILQAEQAANFAKTQYNVDSVTFTREIQDITTKRFELIRDLREALKCNQLQLHFQPQVDNYDRVIGAEALLRWQHPTRGFISPAEFIPAAEESELICPLGEWILQRACEQLLDWANSPITCDLSLSVNVSAKQFKQDNFVDQILRVIQTTGANPQRLILELTESMLVDNQADITQKMSRLQRIGIRFSLDDFGTGYSSLSYLKRLPINELKIDKSFVKDVLTSAHDAAIARMIIGLAKSMELTVIAEGVEYQAHRDWLQEAGCDHYQGYYFGKPVSGTEFLKNPYLQAAL